MIPSQKQILLIDDDPQVRKLCNRKLSAEGYEITEAANGAEGLSLYRQGFYDLVITDLVMPEKEGIETIKDLKKEYPDVKIIAISGGGRNIPDEYLPIAKIVGADRTFSKPLEWPKMIAAIEDLFA